MTTQQTKAQKPVPVKTAISPTRAENYSEWYQQVVRAADMAEMSGVRGCMVIKPWGYGSWELMQREIDRRLKETGHENCYFPIFIPISYFQREAEHVEGFAKEMAIVTHHRLAMKDGKLVPDGELEDPLIVRPTSETVIGEAMAKWIKSYRDLPLLTNQWCNIVRWEMRPRILLRTAEFLWQEGHTAHETKKDAEEETKRILDIYCDFVVNYLALPIIPGAKASHERFPGADNSLTIEAMMQDGRALQAGTSHYLGQNFAKAIGIKFQNRQGSEEFVHTTSWAVTTRLLGALIMVHGDDDGMRMPPRVAPWQVVIAPILRDDGDRQKVLDYCESLKKELLGQSFDGQPIRVKLDVRDIAGADKKWEWIKKGAPLLLEIGPRDVNENKVCVMRRDQKGKRFIEREAFLKTVSDELDQFHKALYDDALKFRAERTRSDIVNFADFKTHFTASATNEAAGIKKDGVREGFVRAKWCGDKESLKQLDDLGVTVRCIPFDQDGTEGVCVITGKPATTDYIFARAY